MQSLSRCKKLYAYKFIYASSLCHWQSESQEKSIVSFYSKLLIFDLAKIGNFIIKASNNVDVIAFDILVWNRWSILFCGRVSVCSAWPLVSKQKYQFSPIRNHQNNSVNFYSFSISPRWWRQFLSLKIIKIKVNIFNLEYHNAIN